MHPVIATNPPAAYLGGKRNLAKRLCALIEATPHKVYIEPFVGMGGVFLRRGRAPAAEIINDLAGDVANLFRVIRRHYEPFLDEFTWLLSGRDEFERQKRVDPTTLTDIERAVRFLYLQKLAFGGRVTGRTFGVRKDQSARINAATIRAELKKLSQRLQPVTIEQPPYQDVIARYDSAGALFYLDPPYDETEGYGTGFDRADYVAMAAQLAGITGRFIMSINDTPFIRETFAAFEIQEVETTWTLSTRTRDRATKTTELIIRNRA